MNKYKVEVTATTVIEVCADNAYEAQTSAMIALNSTSQNDDEHEWYFSRLRVLFDNDSPINTNQVDNR